MLSGILQAKEILVNITYTKNIFFKLSSYAVNNRCFLIAPTIHFPCCYCFDFLRRWDCVSISFLNMESNITRLVQHVVGTSEHIHAKSNLMLKTRCSAKFSSPHAAIFPFSTLFEKLETLVSSGALVTGCNKLQISARFLMDDFRAQDMDMKAFIRGLATVFCGAEV